MGSLTLPPAGLVYVDTSILIYSVETHAAYWPILQPLWQAARTARITLATSELTILETLVGPLKSGNTVLVEAYNQLLTSSEMRLFPIAQPILREAASLRAGVPGLRTPDAVHAVTALFADCAMFLTNDPGFHRVSRLPTVVLDDLQAS